MFFSAMRATLVGLAVLRMASANDLSFLVNYNFDTHMPDPAVATTEVGEYDLLNFTMALINIGNSATGLTPHTNPNVAAFTLNTQLQFGPALITAAYKESSIDYFSALAMYYGCVAASGETLASLPVSCIITAVGYNSKGQKVATQAFPFVANGAPKQNMTFGVFDKSFYNVYSINMQVSNNATTAALIDDFYAEIYEQPAATIY